MKFIKFLAISLFVLSTFSCSATSKGAEAEAAEAEVAADAKGVDQAVMLPTSDNQLRPDMTVQKVTVIDLNATWCGPCRIFAPIFDEAAEHFAGKANFYSVDTDHYPNTAEAFGVQAIPTIVFINPNGQIETHIGLTDFMPANIDSMSEDEAIQAVYDTFCKMVERQIALSKVK